MNNVLITVLITSYNAKKYLITCLESMVNQTCDKKYFEVIVVDDGSTDGSANVCDEYAKKYENIKVVHQENSGGPSRGRNYGIEHAQGEYIYFVDVDDYFGEEAIERLIKHINEFQPDIMLAKMAKTNRKSVPQSMFDKTYENVNIYNSTIVRTLGPWKLFKVAFLRKNNITFPYDVMYEDTIFTLKSYFLAKKISVVSDYDYYYWMQRDDGSNLSSGKTNNSKSFLKLEKRINAFKIINNILKEYDDYSQNQSEIFQKLMNINYDTIIYLLTTTADQQQLDEIYQITKEWYHKEYINLLALNRFIVMSVFYNQSNAEILKEVYHKTLVKDYSIENMDNRIFIILKLKNNETIKVDITNKYKTINEVDYFITNVKYLKKSLIFEFIHYGENKNYNAPKICFDTNDHKIFFPVINKNSKSTKIINGLSGPHNYIVKVNLHDVYKYSLENDLFNNGFIKYNFKITNDDINYYGFGRNRSKNVFTQLISQTIVINNNLFLFDDSENKNFCLRQINKNCNFKKVKFLKKTNRPIRNEIILKALSNCSFTKVLNLANCLNNANVSLYKTKHYLICNTGKKKIKVRNFSYKDLYKKIIRKIKR